MKFQKNSPYLWFNNQALEAVEFYCSLFKDTAIHSQSDMLIEFELEGMQAMLKMKKMDLDILKKAYNS